MSDLRKKARSESDPTEKQALYLEIVDRAKEANSLADELQAQ